MTTMAIFRDMEPETSESATAGEEGSRESNFHNIKRVSSQQLEGVWHMLETTRRNRGHLDSRASLYLYTGMIRG